MRQEKQLFMCNFDMGDKKRLSRLAGFAITNAPIKSHHNTYEMVDNATATFANKRLPLLYVHDSNKVIGWVELSLKDGGLFVERGELTQNIKQVNDIIDNVNNGVQYGFSIGFNYSATEELKNTVLDNKTYETIILHKNPYIYEVSITPIPRDSQATVQLYQQNQQQTDELHMKTQENSNIELSQKVIELSDLNVKLNQRNAELFKQLSEMRDAEVKRKIDSIMPLFNDSEELRQVFAKFDDSLLDALVNIILPALKSKKVEESDVDNKLFSEQHFGDKDISDKQMDKRYSIESNIDDYKISKYQYEHNLSYADAAYKYYLNK